MGIFKEKLTRKIIQLSFMCVWKYLNQRVNRIGKQNEKSFKGFSKKKKKKKNRERLSYYHVFVEKCLEKCLTVYHKMLYYCVLCKYFNFLIIFQDTKFCSIWITDFCYSYFTVRATTCNSSVPLFH